MAGDPAPDAGPDAESSQDALNDQIRDSVAQINKLLDDGGSNVRAMSYQLMVHTIGLSLYNAVHQQQQLYMLKNAVTTAAVRKALESDPSEAIKLIEQAAADGALTDTIAKLKAMMDDLNATYADVTGAAQSAGGQSRSKTE